MRCIYCLKEKDISFYKKVEHVMPQSFGKFENNFTLKNIVCDDCNQYFGDNIELYLARDTFEGISRFKYDVKKAMGFKSFRRNSRLRIVLNEGPLKGAFAFLNEVLTCPKPQIGFRKNLDSPYTFYLLDDIPFYEEFKEKGYNLELENAIIILGTPPKEGEMILKAKGINNIKFTSEKSLIEQKDYEYKIRTLVDKIISRAIAKIAFNYLAYNEGPDFVLHKSFNEIRNYIRVGIEPEYQLVILRDNDILEDEVVKIKKDMDIL